MMRVRRAPHVIRGLVVLWRKGPGFLGFSFFTIRRWCSRACGPPLVPGHRVGGAQGVPPARRYPPGNRLVRPSKEVGGTPPTVPPPPMTAGLLSRWGRRRAEPPGPAGG